MEEGFDLELAGGRLEGESEIAEGAGEVVVRGEGRGLQGSYFVVDCRVCGPEEQ